MGVLTVLCCVVLYCVSVAILTRPYTQLPASPLPTLILLTRPLPFIIFAPFFLLPSLVPSSSCISSFLSSLLFYLVHAVGSPPHHSCSLSSSPHLPAPLLFFSFSFPLFTQSIPFIFLIPFFVFPLYHVLSLPIFFPSSFCSSSFPSFLLLFSLFI